MKAIRPDYLVPFCLFLITLAVNMSMPLFRPYAAAAGCNNGQTALVLAAYILGMLPCYVFLGGVSDVVGRKPVLLLSLFFALCADVLITIYPDVHALGFCRLLQGVALGLSMGTGTAYLAEYLYPAARAGADFATGRYPTSARRGGIEWVPVPNIPPIPMLTAFGTRNGIGCQR